MTRIMRLIDEKIFLRFELRRSAKEISICETGRDSIFLIHNLIQIVSDAQQSKGPRSISSNVFDSLLLTTVLYTLRSRRVTCQYHRHHA